MDDLLLDLVTYLTGLSLVQGDGVDAFRDFKPDTPDNIVVLSEYAGVTLTPGIEAVQRNVQILVRNSNTDSARSLIWDIFRAFTNIDDPILTITTARWAITFPKQTPFKLREDENRRAEFVFNVSFTTYID